MSKKKKRNENISWIKTKKGMKNITKTGRQPKVCRF